MKKNSILMALTAMLLFLILGGCGVKDEPTTGALTMPDYTMEVTGRIARFSGGTVMLFSEENGEIVLGGDMNFEGLKNGDKVTIYCDGIMETYPGQAIVKEMLFHEKGSLENLDSEMLASMQGMGYELETE